MSQKSQQKQQQQPPHITNTQNNLQHSNSQQLTNSILSQFQDPKNTRILSRKQIEKRLQNLKPLQYQKVINNLTSQNKILQQQVYDLHKKVQQLMIAKKIQNPHNKNPMMQQQVKKTKKQLALKYQSMNYLKQQIRKTKLSELTQQIKHKINQQKNQIINIQSELEILKKQKQEIYKEYQANIQSLQEFQPNSKNKIKIQNQDQKMNNLRQENKNLKIKIQQINENQKITHKNSKDALQKFYNLKQQQQKFIKVLLQSKISQKKQKNITTISQIKSINVTQLNNLQKQVQQLKRKKKQAQKDLVNQKILKDQRKIKLQKQARQNLDFHKQLLKKRMKMLNQLNLYQAKDKKQRQVIQAKQQQKQAIHCQQRGCQTDKIIPIDFRKQWIGDSQGLPFDDSLILDYRSHVLIKSFIVYKTPDYISFIKFFYENPQKKRYQTKIPFDSSLLRKLQSKKYTAKGPAFLKSYKLSLTSDRVTRIQFSWSDGQVVVQGWQSEASTRFTADIDSQERPISMFGTLSFQGKNSYALESLGCEINKIQQDE